MNAYELANYITENSYIGSVTMDGVANMLRQQADRIAELEKVSKPVAWMDYLEHSDVYDLNVSGRGIPLYIAPQIKKLSDEEIYKLAEYHGLNDWLYETSVPDFARAILKKASEK